MVKFQGWTGKTVVITGASSGIGMEAARMIYAKGAQVVLAARSLNKLEALADELGERAYAVQLDVASETSVASAFAAIEQRYGRVDVLINNAGYGLFELVQHTSAEAFRDMMEVNYFGIVHCTQQVLPRMIAERSGHIVNIASIAGKVGTAKSAGYSATKHAVLGFTNALRQELHGTGVYVSAINPGPVQTAFFDIADPQGEYTRKVKPMMVTAERVAREIVSAVEQRKLDVDVPTWVGLATRLNVLLPARLVNAFAARFLKLK